MRFTISKKLGIAFIVMVVIVATTGITGIRGIRSIGTQADYIGVRAEKLEDALMIKYVVTATMDALGEVLLSQDSAGFEKVKGFLDEFDIEIGHYGGEGADKAEKEFSKKIAAVHDEGLHEPALEMKRLAGEEKWVEVRETFDKHVEAGVVRLNKVVDEMVSDIEEDVKLAKENAKSTESSAVYMMIIFTIVAVILAIVTAVLLTRSISGGINKVVDMIKDIAQGEGDLTKRVTVSSSDEIGELARWFNKFVEKIHNIVVQISQTSLNVGSAAEEMASSIQEASATSSEIAKGSETQSAAVAESNSSIGEMDKAIKEVAENAVQARDIANNASDQAGKGGEAVTQTVTAMKNIEESSKKIEVIVGVITDIANQTNLLALNAAIEAAKAGEQGKGFAVVAEEVRKLAERSGESTKEIKTLIDESTDRVSNGTKVANDAGEALNKIIDGVRKTTSLVEQISSAAEEQSAGVDQVSKAIDELSKVSEQSASSTEELSASTKELANAADELSGMADEMNEIVNQFKIDQTKAGAAVKSVKRTSLIKKRGAREKSLRLVSEGKEEVVKREVILAAV